MLENCESRLVKLTDERDGRIDVEQIVVADFFAVELIEHLVEISEEAPLLMRILPIAEMHGSVFGKAKSGGIGSVKPVEDSAVVC